VYAFPLDHLVHCLKYRRQLAVGRVVGTLLGAALARRGLHLDVDVIVPVPLYRLRHAERGYNQSAEIGGWVARGLGREFRESVVTRIRETAAQVGLGTEDRRVNLAGAFACSPEVRGLRLAVVDDVVTTGSTAREIAGALRAAGAVSVDVWCVARALPAERAPARCSADDRARPFS
jgi:ComF family protein